MEEGAAENGGRVAEVPASRPRRVVKPTKKVVDARQPNQQKGDENYDSDRSSSGQELKVLVLQLLRMAQEAETRHKHDMEAIKSDMVAVKSDMAAARRERDIVITEMANLRKDVEQRLQDQSRMLEELKQATSSPPSWAQVASQPSTRLTPSSGLPSQQSVSPSSSASQ